jgi:hypothetical protein
VDVFLVINFQVIGEIWLVDCFLKFTYRGKRGVARNFITVVFFFDRFLDIVFMRFAAL